ncbi:phosphoribosylformylglycinamidine synthase subunit PurQ [Acetohalobium arabaticum]|uniref:Phosphoribosylformylglycinamidine synthase subunit PurQ n=1 Tax=Acetohalobium arabaticum (strain ATCC 49924 / DSM 5501 / Z-7288) TaxID=574087 RepID=D9QUJ5_ACEAZ|nr:phosphoribosylformylglycinamidine synthase subunit PurQ [Acetohalobium arabaticum]ADL13796.1 phosphoribosylformylglycinamidine synthase subunit I [Acetohalobium arabaticum DSM 5501]
MKFAVVTFPGSNCDQDCYHVAHEVLGESTDMLWHDDTADLSEYDCIILPGGFSYGDYLRTGAIARFSPMMESVIEYAENGGLVIGICNGFQILLEAGLLPGAMKINNSLKFACKYIDLEVINAETPFTNQCSEGEVLNVPVAHGEGNYHIDEAGLQKLIDNDQIVIKYSNENPNGSVADIAGICNQKKNVFGLMPHPERCSESILGNGSEDGYKIFSSIVEYVIKRGEKNGR